MDDYFNNDLEDSEEDIIVPTADFCDVFGGCGNCTGTAPAEVLRGKGFKYEYDFAADQIVFCTHWCHREAGNT